MTRRPESFTNYRWPKKGDRLLLESRDWNRGVEFPQGDSCTRHGYIWNGYMSAATALIAICEDDPPKQQILVYPILFSYRHAMELAMKWIIVMYGHHGSADVGTIEHHDLWKLWKICRGIITEAGGDHEAIPVVEQVIKDFHDLDKTALAFRYSQRRFKSEVQQGSIDGMAE